MKTPDPPRRSDGICAYPGCGKPLQTSTARHRRYGGAALDLDSFCSSVCCKAFHGVPDRAAAPLPNNPDPYITGKPGGLCACGCGQTTKVAEYNNQRRGHVAGEPVRFVSHHNLQPPR